MTYQGVFVKNSKNFVSNKIASGGFIICFGSWMNSKYSFRLSFLYTCQRTPFFRSMSLSDLVSVRICLLLDSTFNSPMQKLSKSRNAALVWWDSILSNAIEMSLPIHLLMESCPPKDL